MQQIAKQTVEFGELGLASLPRAGLVLQLMRRKARSGVVEEGLR